VDFHGEKRSKETHASTTDGDARLAKKGKGKEAKLSYVGHVLMENRNGFIVKTRLSKATGTAECAAALEMAGEVSGGGRVTLGGDKGYDQKELVEALRKKKVTPHVARDEKRRGGSAIDGRTARHAGYEVSQRVWSGCSRLPRRPTIWCARGTCWRKRRRRARGVVSQKELETPRGTEQESR
jgi:IS5 family transposase